MHLNAITMPQAEARAAFLDYRRAVRERHNDEDEAIMRGYRVLSQGKQVINLRDVISAGGVHENGLPRLAVLQAHHTTCYVSRSARGAVDFKHERWGRRHVSGTVRFAEGTLPVGQFSDDWFGSYCSTVPNVPPRFRPRGSLAHYHILWEAEWRKAPRPPGDPALLKHLGGELYAVLAVWDLTPLEQAVLLGTRGLHG